MSGNRTVIWIVLALWAGVVLMSVLALAEAPTGDGFTRGLNRVTGFLGWQFLAAILAAVAWASSRPLQTRSALRWLARAPGWVALVLVAALAVATAVGVLTNRPLDEAHGVEVPDVSASGPTSDPRRTGLAPHRA